MMNWRRICAEKTGCHGPGLDVIISHEKWIKLSKVVGLYILHPNNIGRVAHIANASYAVSKDVRGLHIGEALVKDCLVQARAHGYRILQFNAVVASNVHAFHLYLRLGFTDLGIIPGGFLDKNGIYEDIHVMYKNLVQ